MRQVALLALLALPLLAARSDPFAGRVAGRPVDCISLQRVQGPDIVDARTILYRQSGKRIWRTTTIGGCPGLRTYSTLIVDVYGARLCRNDRFRAVDSTSTIPSAVCRFGSFVPYDRR